MKLAQKIAINYLRAKLNMLSVISPNLAAKKAFDLFSTPQSRYRKTPPHIFGKGERIFFIQNGKKVKGWRWNDRSEKKLLVLHGYESSVRKFDHHIGRAIKKGYAVYAFDAPAHGNSEGSRISLLDYIEMIRNVAKHYGRIDAFICHSFGGMALSMYLESVPHDPDTKMVLIAPATETSTAIDGFFRFLQLNGRVRKEFERMIQERSGNPPSHYSISRAIRNIRASVLWVHDEEDAVTPISDVRKVMEMGIPNVEFHITKGLGHNRIYRDNEVKKRIFAFL